MSLEEVMKLYENLLGLTHEQLLARTPGGVGIMKHPVGRLILIPIGECAVELIEPDLTLDNEYARLLKGRGEGLCHIVIFIDDFDNEVKNLRKRGFTVEEFAFPDFFPGTTVRTCLIGTKEAHGAPIEFVDIASTPPLDKSWFERMKKLGNSTD
jgi:hypothetical protein